MSDLLDRAEDPTRMIRMIILEMEETLVEIRASAARSIADIKEMQRALRRLDTISGEWTARAELALEKGREDLARAALTERQKADEMAAEPRRTRSPSSTACSGLTKRTSPSCRPSCAKRAPARMRSPRGSKARCRGPAPTKCCTAAAPQDALAKFEILERRADFAEGRADALALTGPEEPGRRNRRASRRRSGRCRTRSNEGGLAARRN